MAYIGISSVTSSSITCYLYDLDTSYTNNDRYIWWYIGINPPPYLTRVQSTLDGGVYSGGNVTINGLDSNTTYTIEALIFYNYGNDSKSLTTTATTLSGPSLQKYNISVTVLPTGAGYVNVNPSSAAYLTSVELNAIAYPGYKFNGWMYSPNTLDIDDYYAANTSFRMPASDVVLYAVFEKQTRPGKFSWTTGDYNSVTDCKEKVQGNQYDLTAAEWNGLCDNVKKVGAYANGKTYNFLTAYSRNTFYYYMYNEVARAIEEILLYNSYNVTLPTVKSGDAVKAADLNILMNAINLVQ